MKYIEIALGATDAPSLPDLLVEEITLSVCAGDTKEGNKLSQLHFTYAVLTSLISAPLELVASAPRIIILAFNMGWDWLRDQLLPKIHDDDSYWWAGCKVFAAGLVYSIWGLGKIPLIGAQLATGLLATLIHPLIRPLMTFKRIKNPLKIWFQKYFPADDKQQQQKADQAATISTLGISTTIGTIFGVLGNFNIFGIGVFPAAAKFIAGVTTITFAWKAILASIAAVYVPSLIGQLAIEFDGMRKGFSNIYTNFMKWFAAPGYRQKLKEAYDREKGAEQFKKFEDKSKLKNLVKAVIYNHSEAISLVKEPRADFIEILEKIDHLTNNPFGPDYFEQIMTLTKQIMSANQKAIQNTKDINQESFLSTAILRIQQQIQDTLSNPDTDLIAELDKIRTNHTTTLSKFSNQFQKFGTKLGAGAFATVYAILNSDKPYATKSITLKPYMSSEDQQSENAIYNLVFCRELCMLANINCDFIIKLLGYSISPQPALKLELGEGSLQDYISQEENRTHPDYAKKTSHYMHHIACAVQYLNNNGMMHRDIKPANVVLCKNKNSAELTAKLCDFGSAVTLYEMEKTNTHWSQTLVTTYFYLDPKVFMNQKYNFDSEIYSLSTTFYTISTAEIPYPKTVQVACIKDEESTNKILRDHITEHTYPCDLATLNNKVSAPGLSALILNCWSLKKRPTIQEVVEATQKLIIS